MDEVVREFLLETQENLAQLDLDLVTLEKDPGEQETISRVFRTLHTVKGTAGFLGLAKLQAVAHSAETLLSKLRAGELVFDERIADAMLSVVDAVRTMTALIESTGDEGGGDYSRLLQSLDEMVKTTAAPAAPCSSFVRPSDPGLDETTFFTSMNLPSATEPAPTFAQAAALPATPKSSALAEPRALSQNPSATSLAIFDAPAVEAPEARGRAVSDSSIRVEVGLLDELMNLVGELVLARNQISQYSASQEDGSFLDAVQRLNLLTGELQTGVMKTRMQPISNIWNKFPRIVRDLAIACGKRVRLEMEGQETELDKTIVEAIRDPLTHMVRNAVDHGIEDPEQRSKQGKSPEGRLLLHAFHEGGNVIIEIVDDGRGVDPQRVREKALRSEFIRPDQSVCMNDREILNLVFLPGFSTTDRVTQFSGRGVGMDVVKTNIEKIGGSVEVESVAGRGSTFKLKIPLTLAIIPALTVACGGERFAIPQVSLLEIIRLDGVQATLGIERIRGVPVYRLRGELLPLAYLDRELKLAADGAQATDSVTIVVLQAADRRFGLVVDAVYDTEEIVVKPLRQQLKGLNVYSGATIMGDGRVTLILDVLGLAQRAQMISGRPERTSALESQRAVQASAEKTSFLLFAPRGGGRMAIPLQQVARLEEFPRSAVERVGSRDFVQYRGEILPLVHVSEVLDGSRAQDLADDVQVVVHSRDGRNVGLVVGRILEIVEEALTRRAAASRLGVLFNAVVLGKVTEFLDLDELMRSADDRAALAEAAP